MPSHDQQETKNALSQDYQVNNKILQNQLKARDKLLNGKSFMELNDEQQIRYCQLNKKIMESHWRNFELAKENKNHTVAAESYHKAWEMCFSKAIDSYSNKPAASALQKRLRLSSKPDKNYITGIRYQLGLGLVPNHEDAVRFFTAAANAGHADAQFHLGYACYANNNISESLRWFQSAAEQGHAASQNFLGFLFKHAKSVAKDLEVSLRWFQSAAEQGHAIAQNSLGYAYQYGVGVTINYNEAVRWRRKAAEQGEAEALKALKKINTPFAHYTVALLEKDHAKAFSLALTHDELHYEFFHQEIITVVNALQDITSLDTFLTTLQETARKLNKNINASLISALLSIDLATETNDIERNEVTVHLVTELLGLIHLADAEPQQIQLLMHFMCNRFYEVDSPQDLIKPLIILWHRARALEVPMDDSGLNRLIAARIVNHLFKNTHCLKLTLGFQEDDLATLVTAYERKSPLTMEQINTGLSEPLLIDSKHNPKQVLPKLKTCILNPDTWGGEIPPSMQEIIQHLNVQTKDHPLSDKNAEELLLHLQKVAAHLISASNLLSVFKIELKPKEIELLQRIGSVNTSGILEWIETQEALLEQEENTVSL